MQQEDSVGRMGHGCENTPSDGNWSVSSSTFIRTTPRQSVVVKIVHRPLLQSLHVPFLF